MESLSSKEYPRQQEKRRIAASMRNDQIFLVRYFWDIINIACLESLFGTFARIRHLY